MLKNLENGTTDIAIVGYPKVGNTWFQMLFRFALIHYYDIPYYFINKILNHDYKCSNTKQIIKFDIPVAHAIPNFNVERWQKMQVAIEEFENKNVVLLIRNPADTLVSLYMHVVYRDELYPTHKTIDDMVYNEIYGIHKYVSYYRQWIEKQNIPKNIFILKYEDLIDNTYHFFKKTMMLLGFEDISSETIFKSTVFANFDSMKHMEKENILGIKTLAPPEKDIPEAYKVREGKVGNAIRHIDPDTMKYINEVVRAELPKEYRYT